MKTIPLLLLFAFVACRSVSTTDNSFSIPGYEKGQKIPVADGSVHKAGDVEIFRVSDKDTTYFARFYRLEDGAVTPYETVITAHVLYDKANYQWINDSTVAFKFISSTNNKVHSFQLSGSDAVTKVQ